MTSNNNIIPHTTHSQPLFRAAVLHQPTPELFGADSVVVSKHLVNAQGGKAVWGGASATTKDSVQPVAPLIVAEGWDLDRIEVQWLPFYYPLDKCNEVFVESRLPSVLRTLQDFLCAKSVRTQFQHGDSAEKTLKAICCTLDCVEFAIPIYKMEDSRLVLEVQRTAGDGASFCAYAQEIRRLVQNVAQHISVPPVAPYDPLCQCPEQRKVDDVFGKRFCSPAPPDSAASGLAIVKSLLDAGRRFDELQHGLSSLVSLTDATKSNLETATEVSKAVLHPDSSLGARVLSLAFSQLHDQHAFLALKVVAQAVNLSDDVASFCETCTALQYDEALWRLCGENAHTAYMATHILSVLCRARPDLRRSQHEQHQVAGHAALALASQRLWQTDATR